VVDEHGHNIHVHAGIGENACVAMREARVSALAAATLVLPSLHLNIRAGKLPAPMLRGNICLKIPVSMA
jgi:hypothetical protein